jgi:hypothetical protein
MEEGVSQSRGGGSEGGGGKDHSQHPTSFTPAHLSRRVERRRKGQGAQQHLSPEPRRQTPLQHTRTTRPTISITLLHTPLR